MADQNPADVLDTEGPAAPPRSNGELVFEEPWESRLFGITMAMHEAGMFDWEEFRQLLIDEIRIWDGANHAEEDWSYYERWAAAFEHLLAHKGFFQADEIQIRADAFAARPHGHDH